jgi:hypothetical protein
LGYPGVTLGVVANVFIGVLADGFDAGIRYEERIERDMIAVYIGRASSVSSPRGAGLSRRARSAPPPA